MEKNTVNIYEIFSTLDTAVCRKGTPLRGTSAVEPLGGEYRRKCTYQPSTKMGSVNSADYLENSTAKEELFKVGNYDKARARMIWYAVANSTPQQMGLNILASTYPIGSLGFLGETASTCLACVYYSAWRQNNPEDLQKMPDYLQYCLYAGLGPSYIAAVGIGMHPELATTIMSAEQIHEIAIRSGLLVSDDESIAGKNEACAAPSKTLIDTFACLLGVRRGANRRTLDDLELYDQTESIIKLGRLRWETLLIQSKSTLRHLDHNEERLYDLQMNTIVEETALLLGREPQSIYFDGIQKLSRIPDLGLTF